MINQFADDHFFLSNFYKIQEWNWRTVEHYFQAAKATEVADTDAILNAGSPADAKRLGRKVKIVEGWNSKRVPVMTHLIAQKFKIPRLMEMLLNTGDEYLVEGNWWGDTFWGVDIKTNEGDNQLGKILMTIREVYRDNKTLLVMEDGKVLFTINPDVWMRN